MPHGQKLFHLGIAISRIFCNANSTNVDSSSERNFSRGWTRVSVRISNTDCDRLGVGNHHMGLHLGMARLEFAQSWNVTAGCVMNNCSAALVKESCLATV